MTLYEAVQYIQKNIDIADYLTDNYGMQFKRLGSKNLVSSCPFHEESDPSFSITKGKQLWHCFGCKAGGSLISFVEKKESITRVWAISKILESVGMPPIENNTGSSESINRLAHAFFLGGVEDQKFIRFFGTGKGLKVEDVIGLGVGYSKSSADLLKYLNQNGITQQEAWRYGLGGDRFDCSIVYPVFDKYGAISYFITRNEEGQYNTGSINIPSYVPNLIIGLDKLIAGKSVVLVEGYNDYISLRLAGHNVLAMGGLKLNDEMMSQIASFDIKELTVWADGDQAGLEFLNRLASEYADLFVKYGIVGYALFIAGMDPDEAIAQGVKSDVPKIIPVFHLESVYPHSKVTSLDDKYKLADYGIRFIKDYDGLTVSYIVNYLAGRTGFPVDSLYDRYLGVNKKNWVDFDTEMMVLSCIMADDKLITLHGISEDWFMGKASRQIFNAIAINKANAVTIRSMVDDWVLKFFDKLPQPDMRSIGDFIALLKEFHYKRQVSSVGKTLAAGNMSIDESLDYMSEEMMRLYGGKVVNIVNFKQVMKETINGIFANHGKLGMDLNHTNTWPQTNRTLLGIMPEKLILVSGPTGHGKTNLVLNWMYVLSLLQQHRGLLFSGEMTDDEIAKRLISIHTGISNYDVVANNMSNQDMDKVFDMVENINMDNLHIHHTMDFGKIVNVIKYSKIKHNIDYVVIDYVQLVEPTKRMLDMSRPQQLKEMTGRLKREICQGLGLPTIVISQLSDASLDDNIPLARRQSESKLMQADADVTIAIRRKSQREVELDDTAGNVIMHIDKMRYNRSNTVIPLAFSDVNLLMREI